MPSGQGSSDAVFVELFIGLATPPRGQNLLGKRPYDRLTSRSALTTSSFLSPRAVATRSKGRRGPVRPLRTGASRSRSDHDPLDSERLPQCRAPGDRGIAGAARDRCLHLAGTEWFRPDAGWRLDLLVDRGGTIPPAIFATDYRLPDRYVLSSAVQAAGEPVMEDALLEDVPSGSRRGEIASGPSAAFCFSSSAHDNPGLSGQVCQQQTPHRRVRLAFLAITLVWLGWVVGGQLSVVNVLTFVHALISEFRWEFFLVDPVLFLLWSYVAVALLFWGRGVFCGWLCPFGALQELLSEGARQLRIPQLRLPFVLHEKLWPLKYIIFLGLFAVSSTRSTSPLSAPRSSRSRRRSR